MVRRSREMALNMSSAAQSPQIASEPSSEPTPSTAAAKQERERSTIEFPYLSLDDAIEVATAVHELSGSSCQLEQLAAHLQLSSEGGNFRNKVSTARIYGLTTYSTGVVTLTPLGLKIVDPDQERSARADAFLHVPLYKALYEQFKGVTLPPQQGLESAMVALGVAVKQKERARQVFQRSAKEAGFFAYGSTKLILPAIGNTAPKDDPRERVQPPAKGGGDGGGDDGRHPLIQGLIGALPTGGEWSFDQRRKWLQAAAMNFDFVYSAPAGDTGSIKVSVEQ